MARHVLLVEDQAETANDVRKFLQKHNYTVDIVESGEEALQKIQASAPSLVVLDIMLKGKMNGIEVLKHLRYSKLRLPIIMLTQLGDVKLEEDAINLGADDYMLKSRGVGVLVSRIEAVLRN